MPTLDIQGREVEVHDDFLKLSPRAQNEVVSQIASSLGIKSGKQATAEPTPRSEVSMPAYDSMGNASGGTEPVVVPARKPSAMRDQMDDVTKSIGGGLVRGTAGLVGTVTGTVPDLIVKGVDRIEQRLRGETDEQRDKRVADRRKNVTFPDAAETLGPAGIQQLLEKITGKAYEPRTPAGKFASTAAEFVPGGAIGKLPNLARNAVAYGVIPGLASEAAGQAFEGSPVEPYARVAAGVAAGGAAAMARRPNAAGRLVSNAAEGATPAQLDQAEALFAQAQRLGTPISRAEAVQAVTRGATNLGDLQHTVEGMGGMKPFYAERPAQNEAAARRTFDTIAPPNHDPSQIGPAAGAAGENIVNQIRTAINAATRPMYDAAGQHLVPPKVHMAMMEDPLFAETVNTIRKDPARNALVRAASDRSVRMYDAVAKELGQRSRNAAQPLNPQASQAIASVTGKLGGDLKDVAVVSERASANGPSSYEAALANQSRLRQQYLQPVLNGPIGKIASQDTTTKAAVDALFPTNPLPNSHAEIGQTIRALSRQRPGVANDLVRAHAEMTFNETAQRLASGGFNQSGGAKFAAVLRGNSQQAANLEASVRALPNGDATWQGFNRLLDVMEAQQYRQATGSRTAFKIPGVEDLKTGGVANNVAQVVGTGGFKLPQKVMNAIQNWNVGRNVNELASLLTSPEAAERFRQLASVPPSSVQSGALVARLGNIALESKPYKDRAARGADRYPLPDAAE
jgi:hypothetical protein